MTSRVFLMLKIFGGPFSLAQIQAPVGRECWGSGYSFRACCRLGDEVDDGHKGKGGHSKYSRIAVDLFLF